MLVRHLRHSCRSEWPSSSTTESRSRGPVWLLDIKVSLVADLALLSVFSPAPLAHLLIYLFSLALEYECVSVKIVELPGWRWESIHLSRGCCHLCGILMFFCFLYRPNLILLCGNFPPLVSQLIKFLLAAGVIFSRRFDQVEVSVAALANPFLTLCASRARSTKTWRSQYLQSSKILACWMLLLLWRGALGIVAAACWV